MSGASWRCFYMLMFFVSTDKRVATIVNAVIISKYSAWQEASRISVSSSFEKIEHVSHLLFHVIMFYSVVLSIFLHICIFYSVVIGISLYRLFVECILYLIYCHKKWVGKGSFNMTFLNKNVFGSVYINPTSFVPSPPPLLQTPN